MQGCNRGREADGIFLGGSQGTFDSSPWIAGDDAGYISGGLQDSEIFKYPTQTVYRLSSCLSSPLLSRWLERIPGLPLSFGSGAWAAIASD